IPRTAGNSRLPCCPKWSRESRTRASAFMWRSSRTFLRMYLKLARRKADELEDFGGKKKHDSGFSPGLTDEGIKLVEELLLEWSSQSGGADGEDVVMADDSPDAPLEEL
ncbi:hypothetical protein C8J57DRAFT_1345706, partial [Mycena rebaudengoi]